MAFSLDKTEQDIIKVIFSEEVDLQQRKEAVDRVCELVSGKTQVKLLIDLTCFINKMTLEEQALFGHYLANAKALSQAKVASVTAYNKQTNIVVEAIAFTQGYQVVNFHNEADAKAWLQGQLT